MAIFRFVKKRNIGCGGTELTNFAVGYTMAIFRFVKKRNIGCAVIELTNFVE